LGGRRIKNTKTKSNFLLLADLKSDLFFDLTPNQSSKTRVSVAHNFDLISLASSLTEEDMFQISNPHI
jgi:hypothetical protein